MPQDGMSKNERRQAAREKARLLREEQKRRARRRKIFAQGGIGLGILVILGIIALVVVTSVQPPVGSPKNMASDGILIGKGMKVVPNGGRGPGKPIVPTKASAAGPVRIVTYVDYLCPFCGEFESTNNPTIQKLVNAGEATIEIHPVDILASETGTRYSQRAANAAAAVATYDPDRFWAFHVLLFKNQPSEQSSGLTDQQLEAIAKKAGVRHLDKVDAAIGKGTWKSWETAATAAALKGPLPNSSVKKLSGTPLVLVNGQQYTGSLTSSADFLKFVAEVASGQSAPSGTSTPGSTSTPAPESTPAG